MSRLEELEALCRERSLTQAESDALYHALRRQQTRDRRNELKRAWYARNKETISAHARERHATDPDYAARRNASALAYYYRRKAKQCE